MQWIDTAIVLSLRRHGESSAVARLFSREHGVHAGVVRGVHSKAGRGVVQPGNVVSATWQARLSEQLGHFKAELLEAGAALVMGDALRLGGLMSACALIEAALPERHLYPAFYDVFYGFLQELKDGEEWLEAYVRLELTLLAESGFGLDLSCCAATGGTQELIYVSPKSGRAVSRAAGEPYRDRLLRLPGFLLPPVHADEARPIAEILAGLQLTGYFLEHWLLEPHRRKLPQARGRLIGALKQSS